ncbi:MAG: hypothetical protein ABI563_18685 [Specibacter sp.]
MLVTRGNGYALKLDLAAVDLWQVEHAVDASVGMGSEARELLLTIALAEWRGNAF